MKKIALPKKIEFKKDKNPNQGLVIVEPCYPGYGITLGNTIRRVLLSSLPGAAVVGVKIKGADHEFTTLPHIREDVLEIILNLKQLRVKVHSDEVIKLELDVFGEKEVKASDINKNSQVEVENPDLVLARITDMAGKLNIEIFVSQGIGYETIDERDREEKREIGYIEMDSIFSPILSVGVNIENVRVGKMTNWDKLILNITTDGTITPEEAFKQSVKILIEQFKSLIGEVKDTEPAESTEEVKKEKEKTDEKENGIKEVEEIKKTEEKIPEQTEEPEEEAPKRKRGRPRKNE